MILKHYANLTYGQTHYRRVGSGLPVLMLHASPMSSAMFEPLMNELSEHADLIAPDTPGYGQSDNLLPNTLTTSQTLAPYVEWLYDFIESLGLEKVALYGTATGAQIAIEFARTYPDKLKCIILDNAAHFSDEERTSILKHYFPDISPQSDGSHLQSVWKMVEGLFTWFPWFDQQEENRISTNKVPAKILHKTVMAYLNAGCNYAEAYHRAFLNEDASRVLDVVIPVRVIRWQGSILKKYCDRYDDFEWGENVKMLHCNTDTLSRYQAIHNAVKEFTS